MKYFSALALMLFLYVFSHAQSITWEKQFHFDQWTDPGDVIETADSGFFTLTYIEDSSIGALWLIKLSKNGHEEWRKIIDPAGGSLILSFIRKEPGIYSFIDVGSKYDSLTRSWSEIDNFIDFDANGDILWTRTQSAISDRYFITDALSLSNGNYIIQGAIYKDSITSTTSFKQLIQKFNSSRQLVWSDTFSFAKQTGGGGLIKTRDNKIIEWGGAGDGGIYNKFCFLLLLDTNGKKINYVQYPYISDSSEQIEYITQLKSGNILVQSTPSHLFPVFFTLADSAGNTIKRWEIDDLPDGTGGLVPDGDSLFVLAGLSTLPAPLALIKYDTGFHRIWTKYYDETSYYYNGAIQILRTTDGGLLLLGDRATSYYSDMVVIKVDNNGYCANEDLSGIKASKNPLNNKISLYPNPATDQIYFTVPSTNDNLSLDIFDSRGTKVTTKLQVNSGTGQIDIGSLNNGLYLYRFYNSTGIVTEGKFVKE